MPDLARLHARIADCRREHLHRLSYRLVHENQVIAVEDLNAKGMGRSTKGTREALGRNVRAKNGLNHSVRDAAFGELRRQLEYKAAWYGRTVMVVDRWYSSSKTCSACGAKREGWRCEACGAEHHRDVDAAKNIEAEGLKNASAPGGHRECAPLAARGRVCETQARGRVSANRPGGVSGVGNTAKRRPGRIPIRTPRGSLQGRRAPNAPTRPRYP